jgi:hypothetical protein
MGFVIYAWATSTAIAAVLEVGPSGYPYSAIQPAIDDANISDTVLVHDGVYTGGIRITNKNIMVKSVHGSEYTTIQSAGTVVSIANLGSDTIFDGFTVTGGTESGIYCAAASPIIRNCRITNNSSLRGGGLRLWQSSATIENCQIAKNTATSSSSIHGGGGIYSLTSTAPTISNCIISDNLTAGYNGGGIYSEGPITLINCIISNNNTSYYPDAYYYYGGGGGIYLNGYDDDLSIIANCLIYGNMTDNKNCSVCGGGGIMTSNSVWLTIINSTITNNIALQGVGGGIYILGEKATVVNSIIWGNSSISKQIAWGSGNISVTISNTDMDQNGLADINGNIRQNPQFIDPPNFDFRLMPNSPCVETGDNMAVPAEITTDITNKSRFRDGDCDGDATVDMGAYEFGLLDLGDFNKTCSIDMTDLAILAAGWLSQPGDSCWNPVLDIYIPADRLIDHLDLTVLAAYWLSDTSSD